MKKLTLKIERLRVESFEVDSPGAAVRGTVHGQSASGQTPIYACVFYPTDYACDGGGEPFNPGASLVTCGLAATCPTNEAAVTV